MIDLITNYKTIVNTLLQNNATNITYYVIQSFSKIFCCVLVYPCTEKIHV